jgi:pyruvate dehydrogenase E2 component (dihydrolipoamide acetyltransferase)
VQRVTERRKAGEPASLIAAIAEAAAATLRAHPRMNAHFVDDTIRVFDEVALGVAVALDDGLIVPVIHRADKLELHEIVERRTALVESARSGGLRPDDVSCGTFTISNLGMFGVDAFAAILNAQQAAILAVGRIDDRIVPVDGRPEVKPMCTFTLSFDHRVVDGARGAQFLETLAELVEEPAGLVD